MTLGGLVIVTRIDLPEQRCAVRRDDGVHPAIGHRRARRQCLSDRSIALGWHIQLEMEGWQTLAAIAESGVALVITELDEIGWLHWCTQLGRQKRRVFSGAVEGKNVVNIREYRVPKSPPGIHFIQSTEALRGQHQACAVFRQLGQERFVVRRR